jgi:hypothetical protein
VRERETPLAPKREAVLAFLVPLFPHDSGNKKRFWLRSQNKNRLSIYAGIGRFLRFLFSCSSTIVRTRKRELAGGMVLHANRSGTHLWPHRAILWHRVSCSLTLPLPYAPKHVALAKVRYGLTDIYSL